VSDSYEPGRGPNRETLISVARVIEPLLEKIVFVGGQVAELLITDPAAVRVRPTKDVDVVVRTTTRVQYYEIEKQLEGLGLRHDTSEDAPVCRWVTTGGYKLDVMPIDGSILGFSSRWYPTAVASATQYRLTEEFTIHIPSAPAFIATKWDAFRDRGDGDLLRSHDIEDVIAVVAGREELVVEMSDADADLRNWFAQAAKEFLDDPQSDYAISGALPDAALLPGLLDLVRARFEGLAQRR